MKLRNFFICLGPALLAFLLLSPSASLAQTFKMSMVTGFNACQINGDNLAGFDKVGLTAGLKARWETPALFDLNIEFLYSQRGSRPDIFTPSYDPDIHVNLQYAEIPVYVTLSDWWQEAGQYHKVAVQGGLSYGRLIDARTSDQNTGEESLDILASSFAENDLSWLLGATLRFSPRWGITGRYSRSITPLLDAQKLGLTRPNLLGYFLTFRLEYTFK